MKAVVPLMLAGLLLAGCDAHDLPPSSIAPICEALIGPIKYTSTNKVSQRYVAALLAMDLKQRNQIGQRLGCPQYR